MKFASLEALRVELVAAQDKFGGEEGRSSTLKGQPQRVKGAKQEKIAEFYEVGFNALMASI